MSLILVAALISGSPVSDSPVSGPALKISTSQAAKMLTSELKSGSLIFSQGDCLAVRVFTASPYTHVGAVVERNGAYSVYDSTGGAGVRELPLERYLASQGKATVSVFHPDEPFSSGQQERFEKHLAGQIGRPYAIRHHLTGNRVDGLHCAEYVTDALIAGDVLKADRPSKVSPASLKAGIERSGLYTHVATLQLEPEAAGPPAEAGWCSRLWFDTKACSRSCYRKLSGWFCCK